MARTERILARGFWIRRGALALTLGGVTTLTLAWWPFVVGWSGAARAEHAAFGGLEDDVPFILDLNERRARWRTAQYYRVCRQYPTPYLTPDCLDSSLRAIMRPASARSWRIRCIVETDSKNQDYPYAGVRPLLLASGGFPRRCLIMATDPYPGLSRTPRGEHSCLTFDTKRFKARRGTSRVNLPVRPLWSGLVADVALWSAVWLGLASGPRVIRVRRRLRAGRCPRCGYELCGDLASGCPECGWGRDSGSRGLDDRTRE
jgi:hypothetical protein